MTPTERITALQAENAALRKQGQPLFAALRTVFTGHPRYPRFA